MAWQLHGLDGGTSQDGGFVTPGQQIRFRNDQYNFALNQNLYLAAVCSVVAAKVPLNRGLALMVSVVASRL